MARNFRELLERMSPESRARAEAKAQAMLAEMALDELREARKLTQVQLADLLQVGQPAIAKLEKRADMYLSTLRGVIKAMGGDLEIRAVFPDRVIRINQLKDLKPAEVARSRSRRTVRARTTGN
jgi:transcriptional regulator with XRE-family HTH domain